MVGGMHVVCKASAASSRHAHLLLTRSPCWTETEEVRNRVVVVVRSGWWMLAKSTRRRVCLGEAVGRVETGPQTASGWVVCVYGKC